MLSRGLIAAMKRGREHDRFTRIVVGGTRPGRERAHYIFLSLKRPSKRSAEQYRSVRREFLMAHCMVLRGLKPSARHIIGIAMEPLPEVESAEDWHGEDLAYLDGAQWDKKLQAEAERLGRDLRILTNMRKHEVTDHEYPPEARVNWAKGRHRNQLCPCGSGKKVKHCPHPSWLPTPHRLQQGSAEDARSAHPSVARTDKHPEDCSRTTRTAPEGQLVFETSPSSRA